MSRKGISRRGRTSVSRRNLLVNAVALGLAAPASAQGPARPSEADQQTFPAQLNEFIENVLRVSRIPGASVSVVRGGDVLLAQGYGVRELGGSTPVDANTIFDAASLTKSFTAAAIAMLVDEGKMGWDEPVRRYLPTLEFPDPYVTQNVTMRDLLTHHTGLAPTNSAWFFTRLTRPQVLGLIKNMELTAPFRTRWIYSNLSYTIAGEAAAAVAGQSWETLIAQRLLRPLGMRRSIADFDAAPSMGNLAAPHEAIGGELRVIPRETARMSTAPAGAVQSSARDLATWMQFHLGDGDFSGRRLISAAQMAEMHAPHITVPTTATFRADRQLRYFAGYGFGWQIFDYRGRPMIWHSGGGDGQRAYMTLLPDEGLGVAVLLNSRASPANTMLFIAARIFDHYLGLESRDYLAELTTQMQARERIWAEARTAAAARPPDAPLNSPPETYVGLYRDKLGLDVQVFLEGGALHLTYGGGEKARLAYRGHETFITHWENPWHNEDLATPASFAFDDAGRATALSMTLFNDRVEAYRVEQTSPG